MTLAPGARAGVNDESSAFCVLPSLFLQVNFAILPTSVVVVVLPAEPVIPIVLQGTTSMKICESFESGIPRFEASAIIGSVSGTPPERHSTSVESSNSRGCPPQDH